ncbi:MAG: efflux RND transporter periplasmic adaptor subunit [Candidatus Sumerlaeota bacterium]|nr:efflux RND transporter periplasmic adaptor subunit [Candidatus Sumerlaeota bacterium]
MRKSLEIIISLVALVMIILWMAGAFHHKILPGAVAAEAAVAPEGAARAVVEESTVPVVEEASGTVQAKRKTVVSSRIMAVIADVNVRAGDEVAKGDTLVTLDSRDLEARAQEAQRAVEGAQATLTRTEADFNRAKELLDRKVIGRADYDQAESAYKVAQAQLEAAKQGAEAAKVAISYAEIKSPVDGRVVERFAEPGDTASPGVPLVSIYDPTSLRIEAPVRESLVGSLKVGDKLAVRVGDSQQTVEGVIDEIVPQAETGSRSFTVKVSLPKSEGVYTGMFGRILIPAGERTRLLAPEAAIEHIGQLDFVSVVGKDRRISRRLATFGPPAGEGKVEVLSGLSKGETVLLTRAA